MTITPARINLTRSWLVLARPGRLVCLTGTRYLGLYLACALVLTFLALMAYPATSRHPTTSDTRLMSLLDRVLGDKSLRGIPLLASPARLRDRTGTPPRLRPLFQALSGLLALGALVAAACPFMHRVTIRAHSEADLLSVRDHCPLRTRTFELPMSTSARLTLRSAWPQPQREVPSHGPGGSVRWTLELVPTTTLPPIDIHVGPTGAPPTQPPKRARHMAERIANVTGWALDETRMTA